MLGAVAAVTTVIGPMLERRSGTILFTTRGAAINPNPARTGVGISFAGEGVYARMLHDELRDRGIHVGHPASAPASRQTETTNPTTSPTSSGATTPSASEATFQLRLGINYSQRTRRGVRGRPSGHASLLHPWQGSCDARTIEFRATRQRPCPA